MKKPLIFLLLGVVAFAFSAALFKQLSLQSLTRDAVAATPAPTHSTIHADGRVAARPGKHVTLSAELMGRLRSVRVVEGQLVKKGELLAEIDGREYEAALREALGAAGEAHARLKGRRDDVRRSKTLVETGALAKHDGDRAREEQSAAQGRMLSSNASAARSRALLEKTRIVAPIDGTIVSRLVEPSETVSPGARMFVVADLNERRVEAEVDEFDIGRVTRGAHAYVYAPASPDERIGTVVEEIPDMVEPRRLRPQDPARPLDSAVLLVKISLPTESPLKLGQRVSVVITAAPATAAGRDAEAK